MDEKYFAQKIEAKWQKKWADTGYFAAAMDDAKPKFYQLEMLPYPSGNLHMGHVRNYSVGDALAWYKRLRGFNVLHPIGWDSFGQPAEDAAIKRGADPRKWTEDNIASMRGQLERLGLSYDWSRQMAAHRPDYYKFDQWFFLKMYERGLAYKKASLINWCENDQATLSNEQASGGLCWRCGNPTTKKELEQWFLRITDYADQLLDDMAEIEQGWAEKVMKRQRDWIGRSEGAFVEFRLSGAADSTAVLRASRPQMRERDSPASAGEDASATIRVFTTRIDTIYGANAVVVAAEHPIIEGNLDRFSNEVKAKIATIKAEKAKPTDHEVEPEKDGIDTGLKAVNPFSGEELPVWAANYVLMEYGAGAVMSVPAHDERDFEFARKYDLPIKPVIKSNQSGESKQSSDSIGSNESKKSGDSLNSPDSPDSAFTDYGVMFNSGEWSGKTTEQGKAEMAAYAKQNGFGEAAVTYRIRDWGISRQRFWGAPIPIVYCDTCGTVPEKYENLPVELPAEIAITGTGESPLAQSPEFMSAVCPKCGGAARRETDTMDTFVDSCWYYFRYTDPRNAEMPFDPKIAAYWTPVDQYIGGDDHAVMHLIYTRFWTKVMRDLGLVKFNEPVKRLLTQGMVVGETFFADETGKRVYHAPGTVKVRRDAKGKLTGAYSADGQPLKYAVERMSKSKGNGVDPDEMVEIYGADAARMFVLFAAPVENELVWNEAGIEGAVRFLQRVWRMVYKWRGAIAECGMRIAGADESSVEIKKLRQKTHQTIKRIADNFDALQFNTPVAALMELSNAIGDMKAEPETAAPLEITAIGEALNALVVMLTPFAPHAAEEMYAALSGSENGMLAAGARFPGFDPALAQADEIEIPVQVNGKLRWRVMAEPDTPNAQLEAMAFADPKAAEYTEGKQIVKVVVVPNRLVNIVVK
jgi:leucyl-tRNA synthetase